MITVVCSQCTAAVRVTGAESEILSLFNDWWPAQFPCPRCRGTARIVEAIEQTALSVLDVYDLTPTEAFKAFSGLGLPTEQECGPMAVRLAFQQPVKTVQARLIKGSNRSVIDSIEFADGTLLYLGASPYGAIVYRIAEAVPHGE